MRPTSEGRIALEGWVGFYVDSMMTDNEYAVNFPAAPLRRRLNFAFIRSPFSASCSSKAVRLKSAKPVKWTCDEWDSRCLFNTVSKALHSFTRHALCRFRHVQVNRSS